MIKVLVADDEILIQNLYKKLFSLEGYEVETASDGEEAVAKAKKSQPSLILLDIMMPKINGLQALSQLKSDPDTKAIPVIMLTVVASSSAIDTAHALGAAKFITKSEQEPKEVANIAKEVLAQHAKPTPTTPPSNQPTD